MKEREKLQLKNKTLAAMWWTQKEEEGKRATSSTVKTKRAGVGTICYPMIYVDGLNLLLPQKRDDSFSLFSSFLFTKKKETKEMFFFILNKKENHRFSSGKKKTKK